MELLLWIVFGALVGAVASMIMDTKGGLIPDVLIGILGAVLGGYLANVFGGTVTVGFNFVGFLVSVAGACLLIFFSRMARTV
jgi:uncharacterized membrane protein YeaQ/YmgE (transglycosylase-associated protein family)